MSDYQGYNAKQIIDLISAFYQINDKEIASTLKITKNGLSNIKRGYRKIDTEILNNIFTLYPMVKQAISKTSDMVSESHVDYEKESRIKMREMNNRISRLEEDLGNKDIIIKALIKQLENNMQKKD